MDGAGAQTGQEEQPREDLPLLLPRRERVEEELDLLGRPDTERAPIDLRTPNLARRVVGNQVSLDSVVKQGRTMKRTFLTVAGAALPFSPLTSCWMVPFMMSPTGTAPIMGNIWWFRRAR